MTAGVVLDANLVCQKIGSLNVNVNGRPLRVHCRPSLRGVFPGRDGSHDETTTLQRGQRRRIHLEATLLARRARELPDARATASSSPTQQADRLMREFLLSLAAATAR